MGPHVGEKWGWDEEYQFEVHLDHFSEKPFFAIQRSGARIGTLSLMQQEGFVRLGEFYILPHEQRRGLGTRILKLDRLRLRGPNGAHDEFVLAANAQNLRKMAKLIPMPTPRLA